MQVKAISQEVGDVGIKGVQSDHKQTDSYHSNNKMNDKSNAQTADHHSSNDSNVQTADHHGKFKLPWQIDRALHITWIVLGNVASP